MIVIRPSEIYISTANVDMRKSIDGLASLVQQRFKLDPLSDAIFVFHNRHCDKIKMLYWDRDSFCLLYKRLEKGKFHFPRYLSGDVYTVSEQELSWLLHGLHIEEIKHYESLKSAEYSTEKQHKKVDSIFLRNAPYKGRFCLILSSFHGIIILAKNERRAVKMQAKNLDDLSLHELVCRLNFFENQLKYMASELSKANEKNDKLGGFQSNYSYFRRA